jgi:hypothetical protein
MRANEGLAWMWLPANRDPIPVHIDVPGEPRPWFGTYPWPGRR